MALGLPCVWRFWRGMLLAVKILCVGGLGTGCAGLDGGAPSCGVLAAGRGTRRRIPSPRPTAYNRARGPGHPHGSVALRIRTNPPWLWPHRPVPIACPANVESSTALAAIELVVFVDH